MSALISLGSLMYGSSRIGLAVTLVSWPTWLTIHPHLFVAESREHGLDETQTVASDLTRIKRRALRWSLVAWVVTGIAVVFVAFVGPEHKVLLGLGAFAPILHVVVHLWQSDLAHQDGLESARRHPVTRMLTRLLEGLLSLTPRPVGVGEGADREAIKRKARRWFQAEREAVPLALIVAMLINIGLFAGVAKGEPITPRDVADWLLRMTIENDDNGSVSKDAEDRTSTTTVEQPEEAAVTQDVQGSDSASTQTELPPGRAYATEVCGRDPEVMIGELFTESEGTRGQVARAWEAMKKIGVSISGCPSSVTLYSNGTWFLHLTLEASPPGGVFVDQQGRATYIDAKSVVALLNALKAGATTNITGVFSTAPPVIDAPSPGRRGFVYVVEEAGGPCALVVRVSGESAVWLSPSVTRVVLDTSAGRGYLSAVEIENAEGRLVGVTLQVLGDEDEPIDEFTVATDSNGNVPDAPPEVGCRGLDDLLRHYPSGPESTTEPATRP